jgi:hypothetical protein
MSSRLYILRVKRMNRETLPGLQRQIQPRTVQLICDGTERLCGTNVCRPEEYLKILVEVILL